MTSFVVTAVANVVVANSMSTVLIRAILVMMICYIVGLLVGAVAERTIAEHIEQYKEQNPIPTDDDGLMAQNSEITEVAPE